MIFAFVMFGAFLHVSGMSGVFMDLACLLTKNSKGGPAKVAIFASALFGTISGSAPANVYGTGTFTIPLMKRVGYTAPFAGAVEAVASTGGQIMPPIMGAAAFIMADLTGAGYLAVAKAALLPALLYYLALLAMIHFEALSKNLGKLPADQVPDSRRVLSRLYYLLPIVLLLVAMFMGRSVIFCAFFATLCVVLLSFFRRETRMTPSRLLQGLEWSARNALMISSCCACAGIVIGVIALTGVAGIDPSDKSQAIDEIDRFVVNGPLRGVGMEPGLLPVPMYPNDRRIYPIYEKCEAEGIPLLLMAGGGNGPDASYSHPMVIDQIAADFPNLTIINTHGGYPWVTEILFVAYRRPNLYICPDMYLFNQPGWQDYVTAANFALQDRFLFGTAYPFIPLEAGVEHFKKLPFKPEVLPKVLYQNAVRALKLDIPID